MFQDLSASDAAEASWWHINNSFPVPLLEHPQSTSKHWLKRGKIMTVNNKKESWLSHGQDLSCCLSPFFITLFACSCSLIDSLCHCGKCCLVLLTPPWLIAATLRCIWSDAHSLHFFFKRFRIWDASAVGAAWQCAECRCFHHCLFTGNCRALLMPSQHNFTTVLALCTGYCLESHLYFFYANSFQNEVSGLCLV